MKAEEIMNRFCVVLKPLDTVMAAASAMRQESVGIVCICTESGVPIGVLTDRDIVVRACAQALPPTTTSVQAIMTPNPATCRLDAEMEEVERDMQRRGVGRVLVVDDAGRLAGVITLAELWHSESAWAAGAVSRRVSERELRVQRTGGHFDTGRDSSPASSVVSNSEEPGSGAAEG